MVAIYIDWGSTNFRAFLMEDGKLIDRREVAGQGILKSFAQAPFSSRGDDYSLFLKNTLGPWLIQHADASILMCGAVGSREGWVETRYVEAPAGLAELAAQLHRLSPEQRGRLAAHDIAILPGFAIAYPDGNHDVMRSEEIKAFGAASHAKKKNALLCIPGTHCKWIGIAGERIVDFHTMMTGELYGLLSENGALAPLFKSMPSMRDVEQHYASFDEGLELAKKGGDLLADLWQVRSRKLHAMPPPHSLQSFLSGILIGHELRQVCGFYPQARDILLVSDSGMRQLFYRRACDSFGLSVSAEIDSETAVCAGLSLIGEKLGAA